ncbi:MAG: hypothetical protein JXA99_13520 [Candidatus Lokiarchaeota archaeon]|nr:hypothetical protein [Candidatus Lokiarchaeota archaeon]
MKTYENIIISSTNKKYVEKENKSHHLFLKYIIRKTVFYFSLFFTIISVVFIISRFYIQNYYNDIFPPRFQLDPEDYLIARELERIMGINKPLWQAYINFIIQVFTFDFGPTIALPGYYNF